MVKYRSQKPHSQFFSRFTAFTLLSWLLIAFIISIGYFYYHYSLNFKTQFTQINSSLTIYQQREYLIISSALFLGLTWLTVFVRLCSVKTNLGIKIFFILIPIIFLLSISWLGWSLYSIYITLNIPFGKGVFAIKKYLQSFSIDMILAALSNLPYQLNSIKIPTYGAIFSYILMFLVMILSPFKFQLNLRSIWRKLNAPLILLYIALLFISIYYLVEFFILQDPFKPYEHLLNFFQSS